jgi:hypothetical protein
MRVRHRYVSAAASATLAMLTFFEPGVTAAAPTEPDTYRLSPGASVDQAVASDDKEFVSPSAVSPPCVTARLDPRGVISQTIHVKNSCYGQQRTKVIVAFGFDSPCFILDPHASVSYQMDTGLPRSYFDGLEAC